jgi:hypothetical protein
VRSLAQPPFFIRRARRALSRACGLGIAFITTALFACDDGTSSGSTGPNPNPDIEGLWSYRASVTNGSIVVTCNQNGTMSLIQTDTTFKGTSSASATCSTPTGYFTDDRDGDITNGVIDGANFSFTDPGGCVFEGTAYGDPVNQLKGTVTCPYSSSSGNYSLTGTWSSAR